MNTQYRIIKPRSAQEMIVDNTIVKVLAGSHAYGMALPTSDIDHRGIFCADKINILTPFFPIGESINMNGEDIVMYELSKFINLYSQGNPNILELLWVDDDCILETSPEYAMLRTVRQKLLSSKIAFTFTGYAATQIKRIKSAKKHVNLSNEYNILIDVLTRGIKEGIIDKKFINDNCGEKVVDYMEHKDLI